MRTTNVFPWQSRSAASESLVYRVVNLSLACVIVIGDDENIRWLVE